MKVGNGPSLILYSSFSYNRVSSIHFGTLSLHHVFPLIPSPGAFAFLLGPRCRQIEGAPLERVPHAESRRLVATNPVCQERPASDVNVFVRIVRWSTLRTPILIRYLRLLEPMRGMQWITFFPTTGSEVFQQIKANTIFRLERLERTVATLLDRLGEGPPSVGNDSNTPASALTSSEAGDPTPAAFKETESSAAPIMVIRDLATDPGLKPSPDTKSLGSVLDDLITPDLALTLISMYVWQHSWRLPWEISESMAFLQDFRLISPLQFSRTLWRLVHVGPRVRSGPSSPPCEECATPFLRLLPHSSAVYIGRTRRQSCSEIIRMCSLAGLEHSPSGAPISRIFSSSSNPLHVVDHRGTGAFEYRYMAP